MPRFLTRPWAVALSASLLAASSAAQLSTEERQALADALLVGNLTVSDLSFPRTMPTDSFALPFNGLALAKPLDGADALLGLHAKAISADSTTAILSLVRKTVYQEKPGGNVANVSAEEPVFPADVPKPLAAELTRLVKAIQIANAQIKKATSKLSAEERRTLVEQLPAMATEGQIKLVFGKKERPDEAALLKLVSKVDLPALREAAQRLSLVVETETPKIRAAGKGLKAESVFKAKVSGLQVEISNQEGYRHVATDSALCVAFGPRSHFGGRYGAGIGYSSVLIDLSKESQYDVPDASVGVGLLGIGVAYVSGGRHTFRSKSLAFGAGLAGVGIFLTDGGQNLYDSLSMAQGFGMFGVGLLRSKGGENSFRSRFLSQGAGRTGGVGWIVTQAGRNQFRCGQLVKDEPDGYRSMAQGFGGGFASGLSGGLGLLTAKGGEDTYQGDSLCQGAGQWGGIGSASNTGKEVNWLANRRSQGAGLDSGGGFLFEEGSSAALTLREGVGHGVGHADGVGFGLLRGSHQVLAARDGKPGLGSEHGVGVFLTVGDDNRIYGIPGSASAQFDGGSVGVYAGLGGGNRYLEGISDGQATTRDAWAMAYSNGVPINTAESGDDGKLPGAGTLPIETDSDMEELSKELAANRGRFVGMGKPAVQWLLAHRLKQVDAGDRREIAFLVRYLSADDLLGPAIADSDIEAAGNALQIARLASGKGLETAVAAALKRPGLELEAARTAGVLHVSDATPDLIPLAGSTDAHVGAAAAIALAEIGDERAVSTAQALVGSENLLARKAALALLAKFPSTGLQVAKGLVSGGDMRGRTSGLELLGLIGTPDALELAGGYLGDQNVGVRIQAALALAGRCPIKLRPALMELKRDPHPLVRAVASTIDVGRG